MSKLEVRMSPEDRDKLRVEAERRGLKVSELVRESLKEHLAVEERSAAGAHGPSAVGERVAPEPSSYTAGTAPQNVTVTMKETNGPIDPGAGGKDEPDEEPPVAAGEGMFYESKPGGIPDLAAWISERTGMPRSLARGRIKQGRVTVDGNPWLELEVPFPPTSVQLDDAIVRIG